MSSEVSNGLVRVYRREVERVNGQGVVQAWPETFLAMAWGRLDRVASPVDRDKDPAFNIEG